MLYSIARRLLHSILVLFAVMVIVFFMVNAAGDPARLMLPSDAPESVYLELRRELGLDRPIGARLMDSLAGWVRGDLGQSLWQRTGALPLALSRIPATLFLAGVTLLIAVPAALAAAFWSASKPGSLGDRLVAVMSVAGTSMPIFWLGLMLSLFVGVELGWLPPSGHGGLKYVILPALALACRPAGRVAQVARAGLLEEMAKPYVRTLRAKGLSRSMIVSRHAAKNAAVPIITVIGDEVAIFLNGAVVVEVIFGWNGIGMLFMQAIEHRDLPLVVACVFVIAIMTMTLNVLVDLTYSLFDPRTRQEAR